MGGAFGTHCFMRWARPRFELVPPKGEIRWRRARKFAWAGASTIVLLLIAGPVDRAVWG